MTRLRRLSQPECDLLYVRLNICTSISSRFSIMCWFFCYDFSIHTHVSAPLARTHASVSGKSWGKTNLFRVSAKGDLYAISTFCVYLNIFSLISVDKCFEWIQYMLLICENEILNLLKRKRRLSSKKRNCSAERISIQRSLKLLTLARAFAQNFIRN